MIHDEILAEVDVSTLTHHGAFVRFDYTDAFGQPARGFVLRYRDQLVAFRDLCPHWSVPLGAGADGAGAQPQILDATGQEIICLTHGARFDPLGGECLEGPCEGERLEPLEVEVEEATGRAQIRRGKRKLSLGL